MSAQAMKSPTAGGYRQQGNAQENAQSAGYPKAMAAFKRLRNEAGFDTVEFSRLGHSERFMEHFGISGEEYLDILRATEPKAAPDRFKWLEAVNRNHALGSRALRIAVALFTFSDERGYSWPSQKGIAARAGYAKETSERNVRRSLAELEAVGAIRRLRLHELPTELAARALASVKDGGSGRTYRGTGYALVPPDEWPEMRSPGHGGPITTGSPQPSVTSNVTSTPNGEDSSPMIGSHIEDSQRAELSVIHNEGEAFQ